MLTRARFISQISLDVSPQKQFAIHNFTLQSLSPESDQTLPITPSHGQSSTDQASKVQISTLTKGPHHQQSQKTNKLKTPKEHPERAGPKEEFKTMWQCEPGDVWGPVTYNKGHQKQCDTNRTGNVSLISAFITCVTTTGHLMLPKYDISLRP